MFSIHFRDLHGLTPRKLVFSETHPPHLTGRGRSGVGGDLKRGEVALAAVQGVAGTAAAAAGWAAAESAGGGAWGRGEVGV